MRPDVRSRRGGVWLILASLSLCPVGAADAEPFLDEPFSKTSEQRMLRVPRGGAVRVANPYGSVFARFGGYEEQLELVITGQRLETNAPELTVDSIPGESELQVVVRPASSTAGQGRLQTRDRVDLVLFVPQGAALDVTTSDGSIMIRKLKSDVSASSLKGEIQIRGVDGRVRAKSARGSLLIELETGATQQAQEFATETGDIEVWVGEDADLNARLATSGEISTDFSLVIEHRPFEEPGKRARATIGAGGAELSLESKRGRVKLLRTQKNFRPEQN